MKFFGFDHGDEDLFDSSEFEFFVVDSFRGSDVVDGDKFFEEKHFFKLEEFEVEFRVSEDGFVLRE